MSFGDAEATLVALGRSIDQYFRLLDTTQLTSGVATLLADMESVSGWTGLWLRADTEEEPNLPGPRRY